MPEPAAQDRNLTPDQALDSLLWCIAFRYSTPEDQPLMAKWFANRLQLETFPNAINVALSEVEKHYGKQRIGEYFREIGYTIATLRLAFSGEEIVGLLEKEPIFKPLILTPTPI